MPEVEPRVKGQTDPNAKSRRKAFRPHFWVGALCRRAPSVKRAHMKKCVLAPEKAFRRSFCWCPCAFFEGRLGVKKDKKLTLTCNEAGERCLR